MASEDNESRQPKLTSRLESCFNLVFNHFEHTFGVELTLKDRNYIMFSKPLTFALSYFVVDFLICNFIVAPAVIAFWRGTWDYAIIFLEEGLLNNNCLTSNLICLLFGLVATQLLQASQRWIFQSPSSRQTALFGLSFRLFAIVWGFSDIYLWKGIWDGVNCVFGKGLTIGLCTLVLGLGGLTVAGALRSALSLPVGLLLDDRVNQLKAATYLETTRSDPPKRIVVDLALSFVVETFVVLSWHGLWTIEDLIQEHLNHSLKTTAWISLLAAVTSCFIFHLLQLFVAAILQNHNKRDPTLPRRSMNKSLSFALNVIGIVATVNSFRGYWYLMDVYYFQTNYEMSLITGQIIGVVVLLAIHCTCSLHAGVFRDEETADSCMAEFYYSSYFLVKKVVKSNQPNNPVLEVQ